MADIATAIVTRLESQITTPVFPIVADANQALPYIVYRIVSDIPYHAMGEDTADKTARFQFDIYAATYAAMRTIAASVKTAISRYSGTSDTIVVTGVFLENEIDREAEENYNSISQDYMVHYES